MASGRPKLSRLEREKLLRLGIEAALEDLDLQTLLGRVVEQACRLLGADDGSVGLLQHDPDRFVVTAVHNLPDNELHSEWRPGVGLAGLILASGRAIIINRYGDIDPQNREELAENAVVGVPILRRKRLIGFFGIGARAPRRFTQSDVTVLSRFARACGIAIENVRLFESTQESLRQTQLLYSTATTLSQAMHLDDVVAAYLTHVAATMPAQCNVVIYERASNGQIVWNVSRGRTRLDGTLDQTVFRVPHDIDHLDRVLDQGELVLFSDVRKDARVPDGLRDLQVAEGNPALALIPLVSRGRRVGLVTLSRPHPHDWEASEIHPFAVTSAHLAAAIDIRQEHALLAEERSHLALVEERKRLARDLHDSVTQSLFAMQLLTQAIVDETSPAAKEKADQLATLCRSSLREMRALLSELRPIEGHDNSDHDEALCDRLKRHVDELGMTANVSLETDQYNRANAETEHALFRIAQEALTNAHKHSQARSIQVRAISTGAHHTIEISDDGTGMTQAAGAKRFGLVGMRERAESLGGTFVIESCEGKGVKIIAVIPEVPE